MGVNSVTGENYLKAAYAYLYIRDFERAAESFARAIESSPMNPEYYFHASLTALRNDCPDLALEWALSAFRLDPDNPLYREHLAVVESSQLTKQGHDALLVGANERARHFFQEALDRDPLNDEARGCLEELNDNESPTTGDKPDDEMSEEAML